ncbi:MAG: histidine phosphatase family protein [Sphingomonas bacterium]
MSGFLLHLLRHGAPEGAGRLLGRTDAAPTAEGIATCARQCRGLGVERLIASDLSRARQAGEVLATVHGLPLAIDPRWRELDFGAWDGLSPTEIDADAIGRFWGDPDASPPPDGERWSALVARIAMAVDMLEPVPTLIVTHGGAMRAALAVLCGFSMKAGWALDLPYGALLSLRIWGPRSAQIVGLRG